MDAGLPKSHPKRRFDTLLFDLGNTLIYFDGEWGDVLSRASFEMFQYLRSQGFNLDRDKFITEFLERLKAYYTDRETDCIELTTTHLLEKLLQEAGYSQVKEATLRKALSALYSVTQEHWHIEDDTIPVLTKLSQEGYTLGMISNAGDDDDIQSLVDTARIRPYFELIISSAAFGIRKPDPRIFTWALSRLDTAPHQAAMIGDTLMADILGAQNANIYSIFLTRRSKNPANQACADRIKPDAVIHTLSELPDLLDGQLTDQAPADRNI